jgi:hypothetical protein
VAAALLLCAALLLGGCAAPSGNNAESPAKDAQKQTARAADTIEMPEVSAPNVRGNTSGNIKNGGYATMQGDWIYYAGSDGIYRMKQDGSGSKKICDDKAMYLNVQGEWLYYKNMTKGDDGYEKGFKIKTNGSGRTLFLDRKADFLTIIDDAVYTCALGDDGEFRLHGVKQDGTELAKVKTKFALVSVLVDEQCFIGKEKWGSGIFMYLMDGSEIDILKLFGGVMATGTPQVLGIEDGWIYLFQEAVMSASGIESRLSRVRTDGNSLEKLDGPRYFADANFSDGWVYFAHSFEDKTLCRARLDGTDETVLSSAAAANIQVVGDWVFYKCTEDSKWYRIKTDGTEKTNLE